MSMSTHHLRKKYAAFDDVTDARWWETSLNRRAVARLPEEGPRQEAKL
jgi:hypothetical protein